MCKLKKSFNDETCEVKNHPKMRNAKFQPHLAFLNNYAGMANDIYSDWKDYEGCDLEIKDNSLFWYEALARLKPRIQNK